MIFMSIFCKKINTNFRAAALKIKIYYILHINNKCIFEFNKR